MIEAVLAYIALGSNLDSPLKQLENARNHIAMIPETHLVKASTVLETAPIGPQDQPNFCNQIIVVETRLNPHALLKALQAIENTMGRVRTQHWGPRVIDCDILLFGEAVIDTPDLCVPHREIKNRDFIQTLLAELQ